MTPNEIERLTTQEVCAVLKIGRTRLYTMINTGEMPAPVKDGGRNYWPRFAIEAFVKHQWESRSGFMVRA